MDRQLVTQIAVCGPLLWFCIFTGMILLRGLIFPEWTLKGWTEDLDLARLNSKIGPSP